MRYPTPEDILVIHAKIIDEIGGSHGIRDLNLLISVTNRPKTAFGGKEMYPTIFDKAATYLEGLVKYHVFVDGNKRTAIAASARFLSINGFELSASNKEVEEFVLKIATHKQEIAEIAAWFKKHSKKAEK